MIKTKNHHINTCNANNLYGWAMSQKLSVDGFVQKKNMLKFNEEFIKNYDEESDKRYIFEVNVEYHKNYMICIVIYHFCLKE